MSLDMRRLRRHVRHGQTVIELWIVLGIMGLLAAAVVVTVLPKLEAARRDRARLDQRVLVGALRLFHKKHCHYPDEASGLRMLVDANVLRELSQDPWHRDYVYRLEEGVPVILSYGKDGVPGGSGTDSDIAVRMSPPPPCWSEDPTRVQSPTGPGL